MPTSQTLEYVLKESCFPDCWKVSLVVPVFRNIGERYAAKNYHLVGLLSRVSKVFKKLVNNRIVDCCSFLSNRQLQVVLDGKGPQEYPV